MKWRVNQRVGRQREISLEVFRGIVIEMLWVLGVVLVLITYLSFSIFCFDAKIERMKVDRSRLTSP